MKQLPRHQCLIYKGSPSRNLPALAVTIRQWLDKDYRCLYLNNPAMVSAIKYCLEEAGVSVDEQIAQTNLVLSSDQKHLKAGHFDIDRMLETLDSALNQALRDGYQGLWASGDMTWELGAEKNFDKLLEYEWRLEEYFRSHPALAGICQYNADTLPAEVVRQGVVTHPVIFLNETLSRINPQFLEPKSYTKQAVNYPALDDTIEHLCAPK